MSLGRFSMERAVKVSCVHVCPGASVLLPAASIQGNLSCTLGCSWAWSFFVFIAFKMFLPVMVLMPQKFAICFTLYCIFIIESFFALKGPKNQLAHMSSKERLPFTLGFITTMVGTSYVSKVLRSYLFSLLFFFLYFAAAAALVIAVSSDAPSTASKGNVGLVLQESL
ncbi:hypothetical protein MKW92_028403 [Papaver armeniacum]|nr:hypothetical protein MKW92_028403 [Papaver armeniacum]